jgi:hypothetical protein
LKKLNKLDNEKKWEELIEVLNYIRAVDTKYLFSEEYIEEITNK